MAEADELVTIGRIERPFGVKGEVRVRSLSDVPGRFEGLRGATLRLPSGASRAVSITGVRKIGHAYALGIAGITTPEEARQFRGGLLELSRSEAPPLPPGQYYTFQLLGAQVADESGLVLGTLDEIFETPAHHVFVIRGEDGEHLLPATKEVIKSFDARHGAMTVCWVARAMEPAHAL